MSNATQRRKFRRHLKLWLKGTLPVLMVRARLADMPKNELAYFQSLAPDFQYRNQRSFRELLERAEARQAARKEN